MHSSELLLRERGLPTCRPQPEHRTRPLREALNLGQWVLPWVRTDWGGLGSQRGKERTRPSKTQPNHVRTVEPILGPNDPPRLPDAPLTGYVELMFVAWFNVRNRQPKRGGLNTRNFNLINGLVFGLGVLFLSERVRGQDKIYGLFHAHFGPYLLPNR